MGMTTAAEKRALQQRMQNAFSRMDIRTGMGRREAGVDFPFLGGIFSLPLAFDERVVAFVTPTGACFWFPFAISLSFRNCDAPVLRSPTGLVRNQDETSMLLSRRRSMIAHYQQLNLSTLLYLRALSRIGTPTRTKLAKLAKLANRCGASRPMRLHLAVEHALAPKSRPQPRNSPSLSRGTAAPFLQHTGVMSGPPATS